MQSSIAVRGYAIHMAFAICLGGAFSPSLAEEPSARRGIDLVLLVDADKFAKNDLAAFRKSLLDQAAKYGAMDSAALLPGESSLNQLVARVYGYGDKKGQSPFRHIQADLVNSISEVNNVDPTKLRPGQTLQVPQFIRRPLTKGSSVALAQVLNASKSTLDNAPQASVAERSWTYTVAASSPASDVALWTRMAAVSDEAVLSSTTQREAATTLLRVDVDQLDQLGGLPGLRAKVRDGTFSLLPNTAQYVVTLDQAVGDPAPLAAAGGGGELTASEFQLAAEQVKKVQQSPAGALYLLDVFSNTGDCRHGDLVYDKAVQTLRSLGLASDIGRIQKRSIDFYADRSTNTQFIRDWIQRSFKGQALQTYSLALSVLMQTKAPTGLAPGAVAVPGLFLQAIYGTLAEDPSVLVVSGSFYTSTPDSVFPKDIILVERANLISAVLNETSTIEAPTHYFQEPLSTFNLYRELLGTILVGYFDEAGVPRGMYSQTGTGVTTIDDGVVVGTLGACKGIKAAGASFAAPVVATKLLVGRMLWAPRTNVSDAMAARDRLLSSALVQKAYLGKYWSGGAASPARLYAPAGPYSVAPDGKSADASKMSGHLTVKVEIPLTSGVKLVDYVFDTDPNDPSPGFLSLLLNSDSVFMLEKQQTQPPMWMERKVKSICICGDNNNALSLSEARKLIKEVRRND